MRLVCSVCTVRRRPSRAALFAVLLLLGSVFAGAASAQECFIGEVRMFAGNFAPRPWAFCDGQLLPISQNTALFSILGTTYGGDGESTFGLPDLRGRGPVHVGTGPGLSQVRLGQKLGSEQQTLSVTQLPSHTHSLVATAALATDTAPTSTSVLAAKSRTKLYASDATLAADAVAVSPSAIGATGGGQSVSTRPPSLGINYIICLQGLFPSPN